MKLLETKNVLKRPQFDLLSRAQKAKAWTVAGDLTIESLDKMRATLEDLTRSGASLTEYRAKIMETFDGLPISEAHLENVFRTNVLSAYSEGKNDVLKRPTVEDAFPYRGHYATQDTRARETHIAIETAGLNGTNVYHKDDPTWEIYRSPIYYECRCTWVPLSIEAAAEMGVQEAIEWLRTGVEPPHPPVTPIKDLEHFSTVADFAAEWDESKHPRDAGKFAAKEGADSEDDADDSGGKRSPDWAVQIVLALSQGSLPRTAGGCGLIARKVIEREGGTPLLRYDSDGNATHAAVRLPNGDLWHMGDSDNGLIEVSPEELDRAIAKDFDAGRVNLSTDPDDDESVEILNAIVDLLFHRGDVD